MRKRNIVLLPVEVSARELDSRLMIATKLASLGVPALIAPASVCKVIARVIQDCIYLHNRFTRFDAFLFEKLIASRNTICAIDEEVLNNPDVEMWPSENPQHFSLLHIHRAFVAEKPALLALQKLFPHEKEKLVLTGNPRLEVMTPAYMEFRKIGSRWSEFSRDYLLVTTNFAYGNLDPSYGVSPIDHLDRLLAPHKVDTHEQARIRDSLSRSIQSDERLMLFYEAMVLEIAKRFPKKQIIVRPHPSENSSFWRNRLDSLSNVAVCSGGTLSQWLDGAALVIHAGSTVAIEASALGKQTIFLSPEANSWASPDRLYSNAPQEYGPWARNADELEALIANLLKNPTPSALKAASTGRNSEVESPSQCIANQLSEVASRAGVKRVTHRSLAWIAILATAAEVRLFLRVVIAILGRIICKTAKTDLGSTYSKFGRLERNTVREKIRFLDQILEKKLRAPVRHLPLGPRTLIVLSK